MAKTLSLFDAEFFLIFSTTEYCPYFRHDQIGQIEQIHLAKFRWGKT